MNLPASGRGDIEMTASSPTLTLILSALALGFAGCSAKQAPTTGADAAGATQTLLNASYDPTREFYAQYNQAFAAYWKARTGETVSVRQSHAGSGMQARSVIDGLDADVVTLGLAGDVDAIAKIGNMLPDDWQQRLPQGSTPYTSTIVFLVRKGNPKRILDWDDLARSGIGVITPNPKTSGGARWNYLAAWSYAIRQPGATPATAQDFVGRIYRNVPVLDSGARGSTTTFVERGIGDVLVTWESEAYLAQKQLGQGGFEIIYPSVSILAEPTVAVIDQVAARRGTTKLAQAYLDFLYTPEGQDIIARNYFRPRDPAMAAKYGARFPKIPTMATIADFGGWGQAQADHFSDGGSFDRIYGH
jgi:sulfate transport system substrate-binding protein